MKILLTGATGFIGANFLRQASSRGHQLAALVTPGKNPAADLLSAENVTWLRGTLAGAPWNEITAFAADACVHTAWITTPGVYLESPQNLQFRDDSLKFLQRVAASGTRQIISLGTCIEYQISDQPLSETRTPIMPATLYARCKNELRIALETAAATGGWSMAWARVFYPYGPGEHPSRLCSSIIEKLSRNEKITLKTPGSTKDYIFIDDLAAALLTIVEKNFAGPINLATGIGVTVREIAQTIAVAMGKLELISELQPSEVDPLGNIVADTTQLRGLGWQPQYGFKEGLLKLLAARGVKLIA